MIIDNTGINKVIFDIIRDRVESGENVGISGFGMFRPTGKMCQCCGHTEVEMAFKGSIRMRETLNEKRY